MNSSTDGLDDLREAFARLQKQRLGPRFQASSASDRVILDWSDNDDLLDGTGEDFGEDAVLSRKMITAAKVFKIAKEEGRAAAVLWKLQNTG